MVQSPTVQHMSNISEDKKKKGFNILAQFEEQVHETE